MEKINTNHDSIPDQSETTNQTVAANQKRGKKSLETIAKINILKAKKALYRIIATMLAAGFTAGFAAGGALNEAKHNKAPISTEINKSEADIFLAQKKAVKVEDEEDGSVTVSFNDYWRDGRLTTFELHGAKRSDIFIFQSGTVKIGEYNVKTEKITKTDASATFNNEKGLSIDKAYETLNSGLAKELASTGGK